MTLETDFTWSKGNVFQNYKLDELISEGPFFDRWKVHEHGQRSFLELLVFHTEILPDFQRDALLAELHSRIPFSHPDALGIYDANKVPASGELYLVREFAGLLSLQDLLLPDVPMTHPQACAIACRVLGVLSLAKKQSVCHNDICPENIFLAADGSLKLAFTGFVRGMRNFDNYADYAFRDAVLPYLSPERCPDPSKDFPESDIFMLGAMLFRLLTGSVPFPGETREEVFEKIHSCVIPEPLSQYPDIPSGIVQTVMRMMSARPADRPTDYDELAKEFRKAAGSPLRDKRLMCEFLKSSGNTKNIAEYKKAYRLAMRLQTMSPWKRFLRKYGLLGALGLLLAVGGLFNGIQFFEYLQVSAQLPESDVYAPPPPPAPETPLTEEPLAPVPDALPEFLGVRELSYKSLKWISLNKKGSSDVNHWEFEFEFHPKGEKQSRTGKFRLFDRIRHGKDEFELLSVESDGSLLHLKKKGMKEPLSCRVGTAVPNGMKSAVLRIPGRSEEVLCRVGKSFSCGAEKYTVIRMETDSVLLRKKSGGELTLRIK